MSLHMKPTRNSEAAATKSTFLGGKVVRHSLPVILAPFGDDLPLLKRLLLAQGELAQFYDSDEGIRYLAAIELREGAVRGNHYHDKKEEWLYIILGEISLILEDMDSHARAIVPLYAGDLAVVQTGVAHAWKTIQPGLAVEFSPARFDPADLHRFHLQ
jgi:mannose-6-phosphate isomerase-like protein (cupin superfamily)